MEKTKRMKTKLNLDALFLATCIFIDSTVLGYWRVSVSTPFVPAAFSSNIPSEMSSNQPSVQHKVTEVMLPTNNMLPDGGPDQPEVQSFTPIGTSDMVDPFTGDFSYNIPLMDVDGYPINISYSGGVTMDQEASWVGLGWNLNPGVVNRAMRGLPDDFNGNDTVQKSMNLRRNWTLGGSASGDYELFGFGPNVVLKPGTVDQNNSFNLNFNLGVNYSNYSGFSSSVGFIPSLALSQYSDLSGSVGLGFSGSSTGGASLNPTAGLSLYNKDDAKTTKLNLGSQWNSRAGLTSATISYSRSKDKNREWSKSHTNKDGTVNTERVSRTGKLPIKSSFNFSQSTYTPQLSMPFSSGGGTFSYKLGPDLVGNDLTLEFSGFYNAQWLRYKSISVPAFGYMYIQDGKSDAHAMLDFNRENDGPFTKNTPALPVPNLTYDIFSVSGQGIAGSYRPVRKDIGHVYDPTMRNGSTNGSLGIEAGMGTTFKGGVDVALTYSNSTSGDWDERGNKAFDAFTFGKEGWYFREANELAVDADPAFFGKIGGGNALRFDVTSHRRIENTLDDTRGNFYTSGSYVKQGNDRRNQVVYTLTNGELKQGLGITPLDPEAHAWTDSGLDHHIGQFTVLNVEGSRYVYGIAAYSHFQEDVSFNVGATKRDSANTLYYAENLVEYSPGEDNSLDNERGIDHYFNKVHTPDFAHSYLLTNVLNADYVDADNIKGPSKGDLGGYLQFSYKKVNNYQWRNPLNFQRASFDEGLNTDNADDKGHYIYGEKELWYVDTIRSKNHIAIFYTSKREDAVSALGENGGLNPDAQAPAMLQLDKIELYSLPDFEKNPATAIPLKTVHFDYDYSLCPGYIGHKTQQGKLTLKKIYFTYQGSNKGRYTPYIFHYGERFLPNGAVDTVINPSYNPREIDRWNTYKKQGSLTGSLIDDPLRTSDFPYVGLDKAQADLFATAWNLSTIELPSGGKIQVDYEADDYAYVQHKRANQMFKIIGVQKVTAQDSEEIISEGVTPVSEDENKNGYIYVELMPDPDSPTGYNEHISEYVQPGQLIYFRALMRFANKKYDFVPGYAEVSDNVDDLTIVSIGSQRALQLKFKGTTIKDNGQEDYNPIAVAAIQFARLHLSNFIPPSSTSSMDEDANLPGLLEALGGAFSSYQEFFIGPNKPLWDDNIGNNIVLDHSWVRLQNPNKQKLGGGHRVKQIRMFDAWDLMTQGQMPSHFYGQEYTYTLEDGTSSGVASYEPQIGGDENPWRQPIPSNVKNLLAPDTRNYQETPFGEQFFPSAGVGYSMVTVRDLQRTGVSRTATGKVVNEFYTAKDFPTIVKNTTVDFQRFKLPVFAIFFSSMVDEMAASQGFVVENNDMHGKAKRTSVYAQNQTEPITKVEYFYQSDTLIATTPFPGLNLPAETYNQLSNKVTSIAKNGTITQSTVGLNYDAVADFRKNFSNTISGSMNFNTNFTLPFVLVPTLMFSGSYERTAFRSATFTKVIERFGILTKTVATDLGSVVETKNLAYDAETGVVLLTETTTDFNDHVYSFTYPAHWYYDQMGQAYLNIGDSAVNLQFVSGGTAQVNSGQFSKGDEVALHTAADGYVLGWVTEASPSGIKVLLKDGTPLNGMVLTMKVLRSGRRNMQTTPIGTLTLRDNPLDNLQGNIFEKVLQAGAVEYSDDWRTFCECFLKEDAEVYTTNPYVLGTQGTWRPKASYVHLSNRAQTYENGNSNIREDGMFTSYNPFYRLQNGNWQQDKQNWTYTSSVVEFSPFGQALETVDALDRYSSSLFGYNQTLPTAVAANTRYRQLGFDGYEDYNYDNCSDNHFKVSGDTILVSNDAHTGRHCIKVKSGASVYYTSTFTEGCDPVVCKLNAKVQITSVDKENQLKTSTLYPAEGTAPYQFEYQVLEGTASVELTDQGDGLIIHDTLPQHPQPSKIKVTMTDAAGCVFTIEL